MKITEEGSGMRTGLVRRLLSVNTSHGKIKTAVNESFQRPSSVYPRPDVVSFFSAPLSLKTASVNDIFTLDDVDDVYQQQILVIPLS